MRPAKNFMGSTSSASLTVTISSTSRRMTGNVCSPRCCVCAPSAIVFGVSICTILPLRKLRWPSLPASGSTPIMVDFRAHRARGYRGSRRGDRPRQAYDQHIQIAGVFDQFLRSSALPGHDVRMVVWRNEGKATLGGEPPAQRFAVFR